MFITRKGSTQRIYTKDAFEKRIDAKTRERRQEEFNTTWITGWRLKEFRLWTDGAIKKWLGEPTNINGYKMFQVATVKEVEATPEFQTWLRPRLERKLVKQPNFTISSLGVSVSEG